MRFASLTFFVFIHSLVFVVSAFAQTSGVRGTLSDEAGTPLSYASIFVKQTGTGTTANANGDFEIPLPKGRYELVFQHLGRRSEVRIVDVGNGFTDLDVSLEPQEIMLQSVTINANDEDPAYSIMRKAIARANYHRNVLDAYSARVYIKGTGKLIDYPWLAKKALEKEGIEKGRVYIAESVSEISYTRPNKYEERVISIRSDGEDNSTSPNAYIFGSFYQPEVAGTMSPLSPRAFAYYTFEYQGTFRDREYEVSRIRVTPRSKGDNVVEGMIFIVEDDWSIHSLDLHTVKLGIDIYIKSMCGPINDKVWLPVSHQFRIEGKVFGFAFEYNYLASVSNYQIKLNPDIYVEKMEVIDEKVDASRARQVEAQSPDVEVGEPSALRERIAAGEEITRKELNKLVREYEKEERRQRENPEVLSEVEFTVDSAAHKKDSLYWAEVRPIPLTSAEITGYRKMDSLAVVERVKQAGDSLKPSRHKGFQPWDLLIGDHYRLGERSSFRIYFPMPGFNTVEGFNVAYRVAWATRLRDSANTRVTVRPVARYAFERRKMSGYLNLSLRNKRHHLEANGGRYVAQYNHEQPILPLVNTSSTLLWEKNLMKIYDRDFAELRYAGKVNPFVTLTTRWLWEDRRELFNTTNFKFINHKHIEGYTPNRPVNGELDNTGFSDHRAFQGSLALTVRPWLKFRVRNGVRHVVEESSPAFSVQYVRGFDGVLGSDVDFERVELGIRQSVRAGVRGTLDYWLRAGTFTRTNAMYFMDYKHFPGNETYLTLADPVGGFRLLPYYLHSTNDPYFSANVHYQFRKLLLTTMPIVRLAGIRENVFVNYLATSSSRNYTEVGYSLDGILRVFRLEAAVAFRDGKYADFGLRVGIATSLAVNFGD